MAEVPSVLEFLQRRKLEAKKALNSSDKTKLKVRKLQHQSSHNLKPSYALSSTVSCQTKKIRKPDISKASTAGGKNFTSKTLHVKGMTMAEFTWLMASYKNCMDAKEIMKNCDALMSILIVPHQNTGSFWFDMEGRNEESDKYPIAVHRLFRGVQIQANWRVIAGFDSGITCITVSGKNAYELKGKFLNDLHNNAFDGTNEEDALPVVVFPILLVGGARRWFDKIKESIVSWVDLTAKLFGKYYPPSRIGKTNTQMIRWDPTNPKFENWLASKFIYYKTMDIFTKGALWDYWKLGSDEIEPKNEETFDLEETNHDDE
ncbi:hypothetical protein Tco_1284374 [Tanacetum coccineum]